VRSTVRPGAGVAAIAAVVALASAVVAGCGGSESGEGSAAGAGPNVGATINFADCTDWNESSVEERLGTVGALTDFFGGDVPGTGGRGAILDDEQAYDLLDNACKPEYARAFKLYKLYGRAAAFAGH
jgi:hypothetical protein